jgi:hypothetical protein
MPIGSTAGTAAVANGAGPSPTTADVGCGTVTAGASRRGGTADWVRVAVAPGRPNATEFGCGAAFVEGAGPSAIVSRRGVGVANGPGHGVVVTTGAVVVGCAAGAAAWLK